MSAIAPRISAIHELSTRSNSGITVTLGWNELADEISVHVISATDDFILYPPNDRALDCFNHPYAYAASVLATGRYDKVHA